MGLSYIAALPIMLPFPGGLCPIVGATVGLAAPQLSASLNGALALNASFSASPPDLNAYLTANVATDAQLALAASLGLPACSWGPTVSAGLTVNASITANLNAALSVGLPSLIATFGTAIGMYAFTYSGVANAMGAAITTELATSWPDGVPTTGNCNALIFGAVAAPAPATLLSFLDGLGTPPPGLFYVAKMAALSDLSLSLKAALPQAEAALNAQLSATAGVQASLTPKINIPLPTLQASATAVGSIAIPNLRAQIAAGIQPPKVSAVVSATAKLAASLSANFGAMCSLGAILSSFNAIFFVYSYSGPADLMGAAVTSALASTWGDGTTPTSGACTAAILATTSPTDFAVMTAFFGGAL